MDYKLHNKYDVFAKVKIVIKSCKTNEQLKVATAMLDNFKSYYKEKDMFLLDILNRARQKKLSELVNNINTTENNNIGENCPKSKENEDEKIRKALKQGLSHFTIFGGIKVKEIITWLLKKQDKQQGKSALEAWKDMRFEVYQQASGNRHEPNYSDNTTKMFSLNDIDEIIEKISD